MITSLLASAWARGSIRAPFRHRPRWCSRAAHTGGSRDAHDLPRLLHPVARLAVRRPRGGAEGYKNAVYGDPSYRSARAAMLGLPCELRLPGCTGVADTADHVVPLSRGDATGALRPACLHCNSARRDRVTVRAGGGGTRSRGRSIANPTVILPRIAALKPDDLKPFLDGWNPHAPGGFHQ